jgi:hypothetical protein
MMWAWFGHSKIKVQKTFLTALIPSSLDGLAQNRFGASLLGNSTSLIRLNQELAIPFIDAFASFWSAMEQSLICAILR